MRWQAPSDRTLMILLSPVLVVLVPPLYLMVAIIAGWQKLYGLIAPSCEWHRWFAWRPVRHYNDVDWMWLEWAERKWHGHGIGCIYRFTAKGIEAGTAETAQPLRSEGREPGPKGSPNG